MQSEPPAYVKTQLGHASIKRPLTSTATGFRARTREAVNKLPIVPAATLTPLKLSKAAE